MGKKVEPEWPGGHKNWPAYKEALYCQLAADSGLSSADQAVGIILVTYLNHRTLEAYPGVDTIARRTNRHRTTVQRSIKRLVDRGHVVIVKHGGGAGRGRRENTNHYRPVLNDENPGKPKNADEEKRAADPPPLNPPEDTSMAAPSHGKGRSHAPERAARTPPEPTKEPDKEPQDRKKITEIVKGVAKGSAKKNPSRTDFSNPENRQAFARQKIAEKIGSANDGYAIVMAAEDPSHKDHQQAVETCRRVAQEAGVMWHPPGSKTDKT